MRFQIALKVLLIAFIAGALFLAALMAASALPVQDLAQYWAAAHLVTKNPYSVQLVGALEKACAISTVSPPLVIKNPPWAILFILPLGLLSYKTAFAVWTVFSILVLTGCARAVWSLYKQPESLAPVLLSLLFGPTIVLLMLGQWTILVLLGITLFVMLVEQRHDWLAGASLLLVLGKPHVSLLFLFAVMLWTIRSKRWAILMSSSLALSVSSAVALAINPHIFAQFVDRSRLVVSETYPYPNLGGLLFAASGHHMLALVPLLIGAVWFVLYWRRYRDVWSWKTNGMFVLLLSISSSYYSYPYDEILVLPALIAAFATGDRRIFLMGFVTTNLAYAMYLFQIAGNFGFGSLFLSWTATAWLLTYTLSQSRRSRAAQRAATTLN